MHTCTSATGIGHRTYYIHGYFSKGKEAHIARAYPGFCKMKQRRVLLLLPEWDASPLQGYPQQYVAGTYLRSGGETQRGVKLLRKQHDGRDCVSNHRPSDLKAGMH